MRRRNRVMIGGCIAVLGLLFISGCSANRFSKSKTVDAPSGFIEYNTSTPEETSLTKEAKGTETADGEEIEKNKDDKSDLGEEETQESKDTKTGDGSGGVDGLEKGVSASEPESRASVETPKPTAKVAKIKTKEKVKLYADTGTVQIGDTAYELYNYIESSAVTYTGLVNQTAKKLNGSAKVYSMVVPTSVGITFPDNRLDKVNSSNQQKSLKKINDRFHSNVSWINLYDVMMAHRKEYIYFRTDHHWTAKGAYYAYQAFCQKKEMKAHGLNEYQKDVYKGFLGTFYNDTNQSSKLRKDNFHVYYPVNYNKITMKYTDANGNKISYPLIADASKYGASLKYCAFIGGDNPLTVIRNKKIKDKSSCLVVKESYGNAFVPYLADHYQKVYVVDYRYWDDNLVHFVKDKNIEDVIFLNNISMTRNNYLIGKLAQICK